MRVGFLSRFDRGRIAFMKQHGFGSVELLVGPDDPFLPDKDGWKSKAAELKAAYADAGIRISCIGGFYVNHMDTDASAAARHREQVRHCITLAREIGVGLVAGFAGRVLNRDLEESLPTFKQIWGEHARFAEDNGVRIAFEHCPMGAFHSHFGGINCICTPTMWDKCFDAVPSNAIGIEWDASHLLCMFIDPVQNIREFGRKIFHIHAKDAKIYRHIVDRNGIYHPGAIEHCFVGVGDANWPTLVKELIRAGYQGDLNIEGWHDSVLRDHEQGPKLEDLGLLISLRHLAPLVDGV
jgi:sugar phosphate isomerase/epimerase